MAEDVIEAVANPINVKQRRNLEKWMYIDTWDEGNFFRALNATGTAPFTATVESKSNVIDVKSARKVRGTNAGPVLFITTDGVVGLTAFIYSISTLIKLS